MATFSLPQSRRYPQPIPSAGLPSRDLPSVKERLDHVRMATRAHVLTRDEARLMRECIRWTCEEYDIYPDPRWPGGWAVWTHDGERGLTWWRSLCREVARRDGTRQ